MLCHWVPAPSAKLLEVLAGRMLAQNARVHQSFSLTFKGRNQYWAGAVEEEEEEATLDWNAS